jgi:hypothetical protein
MKIEGIPEGYEILRIGRPDKGELFIRGTGLVGAAIGGESSFAFAIVRKIEKPKQYRPFANAEEFKPHRDRWWKWNPIKFSSSKNYPPLSYDDNGYGDDSWQQALNEKVFDDGSPFGVEAGE